MRSQPLPRTAKQVSDQAIKDNRGSGILLFALLSAFAIAGLVAFGFGIAQGEPIVALAGGLSSILLWPTIKHARELRRENIAIRMLEVPLSNAENVEAALHILREFFVATFLRRPPEP